MTRTDYLTPVNRNPFHSPSEADRIEAMDYFKELFDDAGPGEEELIASLGTQKKLLHDILLWLSSIKVNEAHSKEWSPTATLLLPPALLVAPIGIPVGDRHPHGHHRYFYRSCLRQF